MRNDDWNGEQAPARERGVTMIELIVGMGIGAVVMVLSVYLLINTFTTQGTVTSTTAASTRGQAISEAIDAAVRTASAVKVSGTELDVARADGSCESFRVAGATLQHRRFTAATKTTAPWANLSSYQPVAFQVQPVPSPSPYFTSPSPPALTYGFRLADKSGSVDVVSVAVPRTAVGSSSPCF